MGKENEILSSLDELIDRVLVLNATVQKLVVALATTNGGTSNG